MLESKRKYIDSLIESIFIKSNKENDENYTKIKMKFDSRKNVKLEQTFEKYLSNEKKILKDKLKDIEYYINYYKNINEIVQQIKKIIIDNIDNEKDNLLDEILDEIKKENNQDLDKTNLTLSSIEINDFVSCHEDQIKQSSQAEFNQAKIKLSCTVIRITREDADHDYFDVYREEMILYPDGERGNTVRTFLKKERKSFYTRSKENLSKIFYSVKNKLSHYFLSLFQSFRYFFT